MDAEDTTTGSGRKKVAAVLGVAALAIPGGLIATNAFAADGSSSSTATPTAPIQQEERPDGRDCPEKDGESGQSTAPGTGAGAQQTAL